MRVTVVAPRISDSARALSLSLNSSSGIVSSYRRADNTYIPSGSNTIINWGCSNPTLGGSNVRAPDILNPPSAVNRAANKLNAFRCWGPSLPGGISIPGFTTNREVAHGWLTNGLEKVYCRTTLRGNSGDGIVVARTVQEVVGAPLYTRGIATRHEFRFHVMDGVVFDGVRKSFRSDVPEEDRNYDVRNHAAGTVFVRSGRSLQEASTNRSMMLDAVRAVTQLGLNFGAVDIIVDREGQHYVIEVNTACGLEGTTLDRYTRAFTEKLNGTPITPWSVSEFSGQSEPLEILNQTQETQTMELNQAVVGNTVTFNPTSGNISTLTRGTSYVITRIGNEVIYVRNDRGTLQGYRPHHFTLGEAVPTAVLEGPSDGSIDISNPPTSPLRVVLLADNTSVNVTGQAEFMGTSHRLATGTEVTIVDMYKGADTGDVFLGVEIDNETYRFLASSFNNGTVNTEGLAEFTAVPSGPRALDIQGATFRQNDYVTIRSEAGGHNLAVGTIGQVTNISDTRLSITVEGQNTVVRIQPNRVAKITLAERNRLLAEEEALQNQQVVEFTVGSNSYRVASRDMNELHSVLRRFTV